MSTDTQSADVSRDRAVRLFTYLKELSELRTKTVRSIIRYEQVLVLGDIPHEPGCFSAAWFEQSQIADTWVEIRKPPIGTPAPKPPLELKLWVDPEQIEDSSRQTPDLAERIEVSSDDDSDEPVIRELRDCPEIQVLWQNYVQQQWAPWADIDRRLRVVQRIYADLFAMFQHQLRLGEQYEVVLGLGLLSWNTPQAQVVQRHLIVAQTSLVFDPVQGTITLGQAGDGAQLSLEQDMIEAQDRPPADVQRQIEADLSEFGDDIWQRDRLHTILASWVHAVSSHGRYEDVLEISPDISSAPILRLAPAIILRRRTERSLIRTFQDVIDHLEAGVDIPLGVRRLVDIVDDRQPEHDPSWDNEGRFLSSSEVYFPLPANDEQIEIVHRLNTRQGVLVQGPPGTGKSHTIANLVAHLLASGQRVLVTSHTPRALRVLREKIPVEIAQLCVSLLGDDRLALQSLEDSVHGITDRYNHWDQRRNNSDIQRLTQQLDEARRAEALILRDLQEIREVETRKLVLPFGDYSGTATEIAQRLAKEATQYSWIDVRLFGDGPPPLTSQQALTLLSLLRHLTPERVEAVRNSSISSQELLSPDEFDTLIWEEREKQQRAASLEEYSSHPIFSELSNLRPEHRQNLRNRLARLQADMVILDQHPQSWVRNATSQVLTGQASSWRQLSTITDQHLSAIGDRARKVSGYRVAGLDGRDQRSVKADASSLLAHMEAGKGLGFSLFRAEPVKRARYLLEEATVDGRRCGQALVLRELLAWIDVTDHLEALSHQWVTVTNVPTSTIVMMTATYQDMLQTLGLVLDLNSQVSKLTAMLADLSIPHRPAWHQKAEVSSLIHAIDAVETEVALIAAAEPVENLTIRIRETSIRTSTEQSTEPLLTAVVTRNSDSYAHEYERVVQLEADRDALAVRDTMLGWLRDKCPSIANSLIDAPADSDWDGRLAAFEAAWNWARADAWLAKIQDPATQTRLNDNLHHQRESIQSTIGELAATKAWGNCFRRMTEPERQSLMAWVQAIRKVGKGTGKYAAQHRREARAAMDGCRSAIPAWIMPIYRVAETVRPGTDTFDVVIVDEASQSGPEALFLQFLAKKIVVVGDDKQISPEFVGISREDVNALRARHIADLPFNDALGVDNSLFDQAVIRYGGRIRLREHFRCMPEIIQFSNNLAYRSEPLIPLRQYGIDRLEPVMTTHVQDGYRQGSDRNVVNPPEAEAIVQQIVACCADPSYDGKSMGVISLQGGSQAGRIQEILLERLGPEVIAERQLVCGDAYAFQGDERDVIFLSLVAAPKTQSDKFRIPALGNAAGERRFNVAASRARDQMWLFHTATLQDLSPSCLRHRLLEYCLNPHLESIATEGLNIESGEHHPMFDSLFEQQVFGLIQARGYRVTPQVEVAGYHIDLVIEGMRGRLAVECDGDRWHGPDRYEADMARQRQLERCGWTFWRVRGSEFYRDPAKAMEGLWTTLGRLGIHPDTKPETTQSLTVESDLGPRDAEGPFLMNEVPEVTYLAQSMTPTTMLEIKLDDQSVRPINSRCSEVLDLAPYRSWSPRQLPDPTAASLDEVLDGLYDITAVEGPMPCYRAYQIYRESIGAETMGPRMRSVFNKAVYRGIRQGRLIDRNELGTEGQMNNIVRTANSPSVVLRELGDRTLDDIPPSEIRVALQTLAEGTGRSLNDDLEEVFAELLECYGLERQPASDWQTAILRRAMTTVGSTTSEASKQQLSLFQEL